MRLELFDDNVGSACKRGLVWRLMYLASFMDTSGFMISLLLECLLGLSSERRVRV